MSASAQSIDHSAHRPSTSMTHQESPADRELAARVARFASQDRLFKAVTFLFAMLVLLGMFGILASLLVEAWPTLRTTGVAFFYGTTWSPTDDEYGAVIAIYGTVVTSAIALLIAVPVSFGIAMFLTESCPVVLRRPLGTAIELLAGVPSIIYGIWGRLVLAPLFQQYIQPQASSNTVCPFAGASVTNVGKLGVLPCVWKEVGVLREPLEAINDKPVLSPKDHEVLAAQVVQVGLEVATVVVDGALRRLDQVVKRVRLGWPGVLANQSVEEIHGLVQF